MESDKVSAIIGQFNSELAAAKEYRQPYENMWLESYRAFYNTYDPKIAANFDGNKSELYMGITRQKCIGAWQRMSDILFNQTEVPFTIRPTPKPDVPNRVAVKALLDAMPPQIKDMVKKHPQTLFAHLDEPTLKKLKSKVAEQAAKNMQRQIEDLWIEDNAAIKFKHAILEATITGSCIIKIGTVEKNANKWIPTIDGDYEHQSGKDYAPSIKYVSIFDVWFDPESKLIIDSGFIGSCDYTYERHILSHSELLELKNNPYFNEDVIRDVIKNGPNFTEENFDSEKRTILNQNTKVGTNRYLVWERWGDISIKKLRESGIEPGEEYEDTDIVHSNCWFVGNEVIKFVANPNKPAQIPYQVMPYEITPGELYGFGIPFKMKDAQDLVNASTRLFIDNKVDAAGPVFFVNEDKWSLEESPSTAIKPWSTIPLSLLPNEPIESVVNMRIIPDVSNGLMPLMDYAKNMADEESGVPAFAHGAQNPDLIRATGGTASGMSMVLNIYDLGIKTVVKNIDDFLITPVITKLYNWYMQYSDDASIKGDMKIVARGTTGLMAKEVKSQRLIQLLGQTSNPIDIQSFNRQQLWLDTLDSIDLDPKRYMNGRQPSQPHPQPVQGQPGVQGVSRPPKQGAAVGTPTPVPVGGK